jgi:hypothetical protein
MKRKKNKTVIISIMICSMTLCITECTGVNINGIAKKGLTGNGIMKEEERGVMDFNAIDVRGSVDVTVSEQKDAPIKVSGDENLIEFIETSVDNGVLNIYFRKEFGYTSKKGLRVTVPNNGRINKIKASGASDVTIEGCVEADDLSVSGKGSSDVKGNIKARKCEFDFSGSSDYKGNVEAVNCTFRCSGSSDCTISGNADICDVSMSGSSDFKGFDFVVKKVSVSASGSSDIQVTCTEELSVHASGSSDIFYKGDARITNVHTSGSSSLQRR